MQHDGIVEISYRGFLQYYHYDAALSDHLYKKNHYRCIFSSFSLRWFTSDLCVFLGTNSLQIYTVLVWVFFNSIDLFSKTCLYADA